MSTPASPDVASSKPASPRLTSLDALRGFDMFWILGADALVHALNRMSEGKDGVQASGGFIHFLASQLEHKDWAGFAFYDLIFPLFVFMVGAAMVYSLTRTIEQEGRATAVKRVICRGLLLFVIGIFYSGGFSNKWPDIRLLGVLQRIGLAYLFGGLLFCYFKPKALAGICAGLLIGYWGIMTFVPIHDIQLDKETLAPMAKAAGATNNLAFAQTTFANTTTTTTGKFLPGYNVSNHLDFQYLPVRNTTPTGTRKACSAPSPPSPPACSVHSPVSSCVIPSVAIIAKSSTSSPLASPPPSLAGCGTCNSRS